MNKFVIGASTLALVLCAVSAKAEEKTPPCDPAATNAPCSAPVVLLPPEEPRFRFLGLGFSVGVPSGAALGVVGRIPKINFLKLELDGTYNGLAPGMKGGVTLDPIKFPVAPTLTLEAGGAWSGQIPGVDKSPTVSYQYENALLGLEFGSRDAFRFYLRGGLTHINANASNLKKAIGSSLDSSVSVSDASLSATAAPAFQLGFQWLF